MDLLNLSHPIKTPNQGNGLAASRNLQPGSPIINLKNPFLILAENAALSQICSQCLYAKAPLKRCTGCKVVNYCSTTCQTAAWKSGHKAECSIYKKLPAIPPTPVRGLMNLLLRKEIGGASDERWVSLEGHVEDLKRGKRWDEIILQAKAAVEFTKSPASCMDPAINILCRVSPFHSPLHLNLIDKPELKMATNAFRATLSDQTPIGLCFEPVISLANHSCTPNATIMFDGRTISLRALDAIEEGEQIFISYVDPTQSREGRRQELKDRYFFECGCGKCVGDEGAYETFFGAKESREPKMHCFLDPKGLREFATSAIKSGTVQKRELEAQVLNVTEVITRSGTTTSPEQRLATIKSAFPLLKSKYYALPPYPTLLHELYLAHLDASHYTEAVILLLFMYVYLPFRGHQGQLSTPIANYAKIDRFLNSDVYNYPQAHHPVRVIRLFTIARLLKAIASETNPSSVRSSFPPFRPSPSYLPPRQPRPLLTQPQAFQNIDLVSSIQCLLILVKSLATKSHGTETAFYKEVADELLEVEEIQQSRGDVGTKLRFWGEDGDIEGEMYASKCFEGLRTLGTIGAGLIHSKTGMGMINS